MFLHYSLWIKTRCKLDKIVTNETDIVFTLNEVTVVLKFGKMSVKMLF